MVVTSEALCTNHLPRVATWQCSDWDLNPQSADIQSSATTILKGVNRFSTQSIVFSYGGENATETYGIIINSSQL